MNEILEQNLAILRQFGKIEIVDILQNHRPSFPVSGQLEDGSLNFKISTSGRMMYQPDILTAATKEVDDFIQKPIRLFLPISFKQNSNRAEDIPDWDETGRFINDRFNSCVAKILETYPTPSNKMVAPSAGYLVTFGLGIGIQLSLYMDRLSFRNLIIVEPNLDMIYHSFSTIDWTGFFQRIDDCNGSINFITNPNPEQAGAEAVHALRGADYSRVDGSYITQHYFSDYFEKALNSFQISHRILHRGLGFVEDEIIMYENGVENLRNNAWRSLKNAPPEKPQNAPALVVGSGPSLDRSIDFLKANREKVILFSAGTALSALIKNDIYPDFHCESENTPYTPKVLKDVGTENLKHTILIASNTVQPEIVSWFKDVIFCTRDSVTPTRLFHQQEEQIKLAAANVTCLACRSAMTFGFPRIVLFGTDFGALEPEQHHSKSAIYNTKDDKFYNRGFKMPPMNIEVAGVTQKTVYTNFVFQYARQFLELLISTANGYRFYNTANGAHIHGTTHLNLSQIQFEDLHQSREDIIIEIMQSMKASEIGERFKSDIASTFQAELLDKLDQIILQIEKADSFESLYDYLRHHIQYGHGDTLHGMDAAVRVITSGTFILICQHVDWLQKRMTTDDWQEVWPKIKHEIADHTDQMKSKIISMFNRLQTTDRL